jgi:hypothetical protein
VTTTYGKDDRDRCRQWVVALFADPSRQLIYAASPDRRIQTLAVADGTAVWNTAITLLPQRENVRTLEQHPARNNHSRP